MAQTDGKEADDCDCFVFRLIHIVLKNILTSDMIHYEFNARKSSS